MRSNEEINQEQMAYVKAVNDALSKLRGEGGRWWDYTVSHRTFELVVGDPAGKDNIVLSLAACQSIAGPVSWPNQCLEVIWRIDKKDQRALWEFTLQDLSVNFKAIGNVFAWRSNYDLLNLGS